VRRIKILGGTGFKSALYASLAFAFTTLCLSTFVYYMVKNNLYGELQNQIQKEVVFLQKMYRKGGHGALIKHVQTIENQQLQTPKLIGLFDEGKSKLGGNTDRIPNFNGWDHVRHTVAFGKSDNQYYAYTTSIGSATMVVGQPVGIITPALKSLFWLLIFASALAIITSLGIGYLASRRDSVKLNNIVDTLRAVSRGDDTARIAVAGSNDQLNQVSEQINHNLDRLSSLMDNTKQTATAIAHDLRTPINRASLMLQEAKQSVNKQAADSGAMIERAENELHNVSDIFDTILRISRVSLSDDTKNFERLSLFEVVDDMVQTYQPVAAEQNIALSLAIDKSVEYSVQGDKNMLRQALVNLIENAITYCPDAADIVVSVFINDEQLICLDVSDNGPGLPEESLEKVLEPFYRENSSRDSPGNGLGLALVKAIANKHRALLQLRNLHPGLSCMIIFPLEIS